MLTEQDVVDSVSSYLREHGFRVVAVAGPTQKGWDITATRADGRRVRIEAKGAGSSQTHTSRFGREFTSNQAYDHVAKAVLRVMKGLSEAEEGSANELGIALPANHVHRRVVQGVSPALERLGIVVFWVDESLGVTVDGAWAS